jgi:hypothetical protein
MDAFDRWKKRLPRKKLSARERRRFEQMCRRADRDFGTGHYLTLDQLTRQALGLPLSRIQGALPRRRTHATVLRVIRGLAVR